MAMVSPPDFSVEDNLKLCVTRKVKTRFGTKFLFVQNAMVADESKYRTIAPAFCGFVSSNCESSLAEEVEKLYLNRMVKKNGSGRSSYDKILVLSPICPYCLERTSETLDHFLPKVKFKLLAITPLNLIPSCETCNRKKSDGDMLLHDKQFIHPYFETLFGFKWLGAKVKGAGADRPLVEFFVDQTSVSEPLLATRIEHQFVKLALGRLYSIQAGVEVNSLRETLQVMHDASGINGVRRELEELEAQWSGSSDKVWKAVMFKALAESDWYCSRGFANAS
jgi:hypothetical protein